MTRHTLYDADGSPYYFDDDPLVFPDGASEEVRQHAWEVQARAAAFWLLFPEL